ncbi:MAG: glycoside hydrolase family 3 C-terminal domain-containing protein [Lachnospiraceae bacterium]|nr:glycoside hydrolase family 3 C-terminal domain-containing protein [Lachnospiraceae bacterium]
MDQKALEALFQDMSTEEKVMQLVQIPGSEYEADAEITGVDRGQVKDRVKRLAGSTLGIWGSKRLKKVQEQYMKEHPHHIPLMFMLDVIHGHKTVLPCPLGQGASFDPEEVKKGAAMQAREAAADGIHATFSPMADLCRDARWGRIMESTGEDKFLNSCMAKAMVMTSFNSINGIPATGSTFLMKKILREEFGFKGVLISDWGAVGEMINHGYAEDQRDAALKAMQAGVDIDMCSGCYSAHLEELVNSGAVSGKMLDQDAVTARGIRHVDNWQEENDRLLAEAVSAAEWADTVILCLGEDSTQSGEATSKASLKLPAVQLKLLREIRKTGKKIVSLIFTGRPLELDEVRELSDALLICWLPGTEGGHAVLDVLTGKLSPSGRLPVSFPYTVGQEPLHYDMYPTGRPKPENAPFEYTSRYLDCENGALYPFGYGLSYTSFEYTGQKLSTQKMSASEPLTASVTVRNTGNRKGDVTVQLYIRDVCGSRVRPVRELAGFQKLSLDPGAEEEVSFVIKEEMLRFWTAEEKWESEAGKFLVWICDNSSDGKPLEFLLES